MRRAITGNTGPRGTLNNDKITQALLQYRNTPLKDINLSPAQLLLGRTLRDGIPQQQEDYHISSHWQTFLRERERSMAKVQANSKAYHDKQPIRKHKELQLGQPVACQNAKKTRNGI